MSTYYAQAPGGGGVVKTGQRVEECCCVSHQSQSLRRAPHSRYKALEGGVGANFWMGVIPHRGLKRTKGNFLGQEEGKKGQEEAFPAEERELAKDRKYRRLCYLQT